MLHLHYFISRKESLEPAEFHRYWKQVHGPIVKQIDELQRYVQSHRVPLAGQNSPYDGAAEAWVEDLDALNMLKRNRAYLDGALADEPNFINMGRVEWLTTEDDVFIDGPTEPGLVKLVFCLKRQPGYTIEAAHRYWREEHGPIVAAIPGLVRYVQCHTIDAAYEFAEPRWDGIAQLWLRDVAAVEQMLASPEFSEVAWRDAARFVNMDTVESFLAEEYTVIAGDGNP